MKSAAAVLLVLLFPELGHCADFNDTFKFSIVAVGGMSIPSAGFDREVYLGYGGARIAGRAGLNIERTISRSAAISIGYHYFRFGSDNVGRLTPPPGPGRKDDHEAYGHIGAVEVALRNVFGVGKHGALPFLSAGFMIGQGEFVVRNLRDPNYMIPGEESFNADFKVKRSIGFDLGGGILYRLLDHICIMGGVNYRFMPVQEKPEREPFSRSIHFRPEWVDLYSAISYSI